MKLIMENFKQFLDEAAKSLDDLGEYKVFIDSEDAFETISIGTDENENAVGYIQIEPLECSNDKVWSVNQVDTFTTGWGPLLYDLAMERAVMRGRQGLTSDKTNATSNAALNVWKFYRDNRADEFDIVDLKDLCPKKTPEPRLASNPHLRKGDDYEVLTKVFKIKRKHLLTSLNNSKKLVMRRHK